MQQKQDAVIDTRRRQFVLVSVATLIAGATRLNAQEPTIDQLRELEQKTGGRLGIFVWNATAAEGFGHRLDERFAMCSTFKMPLAGVILREVDQGRLSLDQFVPFSEKDMVDYAPVTGPQLRAGGMTVGDLAQAAQMHSDNVAANLLLGLVGGPAGFTEVIRSMGDMKTRLDRYEPDMNNVPAGEIRDTTTPKAMVETMARFLSGENLSVNSRSLLQEWMVATNTGRNRIRAGWPDAWRSGDKTGTVIAADMPNKYNDIAVAWNAEGHTLFVAAYFEADSAYENLRPVDEAVLQEVGRISANTFD